MLEKTLENTDNAMETLVMFSNATIFVLGVYIGGTRGWGGGV